MLLFMKKIISSRSINCKKNTYLIDLVELASETYSIHLLQTPTDAPQYKISISPEVLPDLINQLSAFQQRIANLTKKQSASRPSTEEKKSLISRYLKGVTIEDLALQFNCSVSRINQVIQEDGKAIVDNRLPKRYLMKKKSNIKR